MYIDLEIQSRLQPYVSFDWRLLAERGLRCYGHFHQLQRESRTVATCEIGFLSKMSHEEQQSSRSQQQQRLAGSSSTRSAGQFKCVGAIRKAGFLSVKKWILKRHQSIELARKQGWKRYWVCLRGTALLFHTVIDKQQQSGSSLGGQETIDLHSWIRENCCADSQTQITEAAAQFNMAEGGSAHLLGQKESAKKQGCFIEREARHLIIVDGAIGQPIPEHPKRDFVFCLSTTFGDAYLFQASCQPESDNWISALHNACAASIARDLTRDEASKFFEAKIRHLEVEAEKKLFLRVRLESRLNSMSSMSHISALVGGDFGSMSKSSELEDKRATMRTLLFKLQQQLMALDSYLEQVHCEIYQLRCYLSSCLAQHNFYQPDRTLPAAIDLPHPRTLLMHVSKHTKLILIKLGVFTVSSLHAFIHARQGSADSILLKIQEHAERIIGNLDLHATNEQAATRQRAQSISDRWLGSKKQALELEANTEQLIQLSNLRPVSIRLARSLFEKLRLGASPISQSDDRYSIHDEGGAEPSINVKLNPNSSANSIIKLLLSVIQASGANASQEAHNYYLRFQPSRNKSDAATEARESRPIYVPKRGETLADWSSFEHLELAEKIVFRVQLTRGRMHEEATPFGFSVGAQLVESGGTGQQLDVYCSYIEWGSVADRAGLVDEDELLMINGIPVMDLDMMFIECIIQDESSLNLVVRSCRPEPPANATLLDRDSWRPTDGGGGASGSNEDDRVGQVDESKTLGSKLITDEYISSLVCPPPPSRSRAFLRTDPSLLRQKSDLQISDRASPKVADQAAGEEADEKLSRLVASATIPSLADEASLQIKARSQAELRTAGEDGNACESQSESKKCAEVASWESDSGKTPAQASRIQDPNLVERMRKSILELLETEYAYVRHLETINEHYMGPISEANYLNIADLEHLHMATRRLSSFQKEFFVRLLQSITSTHFPTGDLSADASLASPSKLAGLSDESEELNKIVRHLESQVDIDSFKATLRVIARIFTRESDNFRAYSAYCVAYSRLQKFLHPRRCHNTAQSNISPGQHPMPLDTFVASGQTAPVQAPANQRDFFKPLGSFMPHGNSNGSKNAVSNSSSNSSNSSTLNEQQHQQLEAQLKQLSEFLANLDSSSSSVSVSLPTKSSLCSSIDHSQSDSQKRSHQASKNQISGASSSSTGGSNAQWFQKSVNQQNFESYLIKPIQRIVRYPMLLNSIAQVYNYGDEDEAVNGDLHSAIKQMSSITSHVNEAQKIQDEYGPTFANIERLFHSMSQDSKLSGNSLMSQPPVNLAIEHLLHFGPVDWLNMQEFTGTRNGSKRASIPASANLSQVLFVFNSCVVFICKERANAPSDATCNGANRSTGYRKLMSANSASATNGSTFHLQNGNSAQATNAKGRESAASSKEIIRYQSIIPVCEVQVRSVSQHSASNKQIQCRTEPNFQWELFRCSSVNSNSNLLTKTSKQRQTNGKVYLLASPSNEIRNAFLRKIRMIIRDSVRSMSLPIARSPSSKSLTPKKLSSPSSSTSSKTRTSSQSCSRCEET